MSSIHILLVDDSKVVRMVIAKQLEKLGFSTDIAEDGNKAVDSVKGTAYDLIFMDVMMPEMDGLEATKQIRQFEQAEGRMPTIIIGITGYTNRAECIAAGMDDFMFKPVTIEQLKGTIKHWHPDETLPTSAAPASLFTDDAASTEQTEQTAQRIEDLKKRLGFG
jgi:CheY-like chemotaxis protein